LRLVQIAENVKREMNAAESLASQRS